MSNLDSKRDEFAHRLEQLSGEHTLANALPALPDDTLQARLQAWEALLDQRLAEQRGVVRPAPVPEIPATSTPQATPAPRRMPFGRGPEATLAAWLTDLDEMLLNQLELGRHPIPAGFRQPIRLYETSQEFRAAVASACGLAQLPQAPPSPYHSPAAVHIPSQGTLLNLEHYRQQHGEQDLTLGNAAAHAHVLGEAAVERWGWGYMLEYTRLGQKAGASGLWPALLAGRLGLPFPDQRAAALAAALHQSWLLTEAGWLDWVWQFVMFKARHPVGEKLFQRSRPGRWLELLNKVVNLFPLYLTPYGVRVRLLNLIDLFRFLFLEESEILPRTLHSVLTVVQELCTQHDKQAANELKEPLSRFLGRVYFAQMEANIGILSTPYAVLIACHVEELDLSSAAALLEKAAETPRNNSDTRMAMLSKLDSRVKYDPKAMYIAAWERLKLNGPQEYFK